MTFNGRRKYSLIDLQCRFKFLCREHHRSEDEMEGYKGYRTYYRWIIIVMLLFIFQSCYKFHMGHRQNSTSPNKIAKLQLGCEKWITYKWFMTMKSLHKNTGEEEILKYPKETPICKLKLSNLGPITVNKTKLNLEWVEQQYPYVKAGGYYAPEHCRSRHKVAILVPYRNRETNLVIFLYHIHRFLKKQLLEYRIFVIEQYGFLDSQRFGKWHCLIFHDVDLLPLDERILYSCPRQPTHMSTAVESQGFQLPYAQMFGGVTSLTLSQFEAVNGYSNFYWNWGAEDDDMFVRLQARRYPVVHHNHSIARYATLQHESNEINDKRYFTLSLAKRRFRTEGLKTVKYRLIKITKRKLFTHILADVTPLKCK